MSVKSVYNFVPAPKENEVFKPDWADQVSHDIPFSDGESGEIEIKITAESPIFIRNGHSQADAELFRKSKEDKNFKPTDEEQKRIDQYLAFSNYKGKYFIPGSSLKGMFRNVLEIISHSKLNQLNNHRHSVRQIIKRKDDVMDEGYELSQDKVKRKIKCGYLVKREGKYYIHSCGQPLKIRFTDIDKKYHKDFKGLFGEKDKANIKKNFDHRTAAYKYRILKEEDLEGSFEMHPLNENDKQKSWVSKFQPLKYVRFADDVIDQNRIFTGKIVLVGQASNYNIPTARKGEYVFRGKKAEVLKDNENRLEVSSEDMEDFKFVNRDGKGDNQELKDWAFWKDKIHQGIPVFYREKEIKGERQVLDFGLSFTYKQPAKYKVKDLLPDYSQKKDLAETIFGTVEENGLKGRVFFGNAWCLEETPKKKGKVAVTLGSPKSSFTPFYIKQKGNNGKTTRFDTYNTGGRLRGYKRYPVKNKIKSHPGESLKMQSHFFPLDEGTSFTAKIRFHNLRPLELGALLSAITLNDTKETFHILGYAKPLGYGKINVNSIKLSGLKNKEEFYTEKFQVEMLARYGQSWTSKINELLSMSINPSAKVEDELEYNDLEDFQKIKDDGLYLQDYTAYGMNYNFNPGFGKEVEFRLSEMKKKENKKLKEIELLKKEVEALKDKEEYKEAIEKIKELNSKEKIENKKDRIQELELLSKKKEEENEIENMIKRENLVELKEFIKENPYHNRANEIHPLIKKLTPNQYPQRYKKIDLRKFLKEVPSWIKKNKVNVDDFEDELFADLKRVLSEELAKKGRRKNWEDFTNRNWSKVKTIIGQEHAKDLYVKLIKE